MTSRPVHKMAVVRDEEAEMRPKEAPVFRPFDEEAISKWGEKYALTQHHLPHACGIGWLAGFIDLYKIKMFAHNRGLKYVEPTRRDLVEYIRRYSMGGRTYKYDETGRATMVFAEEVYNKGIVMCSLATKAQIKEWEPVLLDAGYQMIYKFTNPNTGHHCRLYLFDRQQPDPPFPVEPDPDGESHD
jgi:hypothetical protein